MKRGPKAELPSEHLKRGTLQPSRHGSRKAAASQFAEIAENAVTLASAMPGKPDSLSAEAQLVWDDDIARAVQGGYVAERDQTMFAQYCQVVGACNACWKTGAVPPAAYLTEARKLAEMFGLLGAKSRVKGKSDGAETDNPVARSARRPPG